MIKLEAGDRVLLCGLFMPRLMRMYAASVGSQPTQRNSSAEYGLELAHRSKPESIYAKDKSYYSRCGLFVPRLDFRQYDDDIWFWGSLGHKPIQSDHHDFNDDDDGYTRCM